jgi:ribosomal protein L37AE/L43A/transposase-like protein
MESPATLDEFYRMFPTEHRCWAYLRRARWPHGFRCPRCEGRKAHRLRGRGLWQCTRCRYQASLTAGTPFHGTRVPLRTWFLAMFFVARHKKGISALQFQRTAGLGSYKTAWTLLHKVRSALGRNPLFRLTGDVEVDETYVGPRGVPGPRGRGAREKTPVAIAVESRGDHAGRLRFGVLEGVAREDLVPFVRGAVDPRRATVRTDGLPSYGGLQEAGVRHRARVQRSPRRAAKILPWAHTVASNLKTWLRGTFHGVSPKHLPRYLDEFAYRFDRRWREEDLFAFVARRLARGHPLPYGQLVAERAA